MSEGIKPKIEYNPQGEPTQEQLKSFLDLIGQLAEGGEMKEYSDGSSSIEKSYQVSPDFKIEVNKYIVVKPTAGCPESESLGHIDIETINGTERDWRLYSVERGLEERPGELFIMTDQALSDIEGSKLSDAAAKNPTRVEALFPFLSSGRLKADQETIIGLMQLLATLKEKK